MICNFCASEKIDLDLYCNICGFSEDIEKTKVQYEEIQVRHGEDRFLTIAIYNLPIQIEKFYFDIGDEVKPGDVIFKSKTGYYSSEVYGKIVEINTIINKKYLEIKDVIVIELRKN
jgi:hypothetical protein